MKCTQCGADVRPVVAHDIDGCLAQYHQPFYQHACRYTDTFLPNIDEYDGKQELEDFLVMDRNTFDQVKLSYRQGGFKRFAPRHAHAVMNLRDVYYDGNFELWLTTTRPYLRLDSIDPDTRFWLERNGIKFDHLLYDEHKYIKLYDIVGERLCCVIDDLPQMAVEALEVCANVALIARPWNAYWRENDATDYDQVVIIDEKDTSDFIKNSLGAWQHEHSE